MEIYEPNVFEVEFIDLQGKTYAVETLNASQAKQKYQDTDRPKAPNPTNPLK